MMVLMSPKNQTLNLRRCLQTSIVQLPLPAVDLLFSDFDGSDEVQVQEHEDPYEHFEGETRTTW